MINKHDKRRQSTTACILQTDAVLHDYIPPLQGLSVFRSIPQGVALGWYIAPLQGWQQLCREPCR
jgi:hypothetical protein